jgi:ubiquinone/menaquinone biosynthesis C-methylase UbiE
MDTRKLRPSLQKILAYRRKKRVSYLLSKVTIKPQMKIIDLGCGPDGRSFEDFVPPDWQITGVDVLSPEKIHIKHPGFTYVQQDARDLSRFKDQELDLLVSFGMLEHIIKDEIYRQVISEIMRVAQQYIVVVPNKYAVIEPHYGFPFFALYPHFIQKALVRIFNLSEARRDLKKDPDFIRKRCVWRSNSQYRKDFPGSRVYVLHTLDSIAIVKKKTGDVISPFTNAI